MLAGALGLQAPRRADVDETRVNRLIEERAEARRQKNFKRADEIRAEIEQLGAILEDKPGSTGWRWKGR
jgi:cysteinyl-tRNA synthetase